MKDSPKIHKVLSQAHTELIVQHTQTRKCVEELGLAYGKLQRTEELHHKTYLHDLKLMLYTISHSVRQPIANILGLANLLDTTKNSPLELKKIMMGMKKAAKTINIVTKELTLFLSNLEQNEKNKNAG